MQRPSCHPLSLASLALLMLLTAQASQAAGVLNLQYPIPRAFDEAVTQAVFQDSVYADNYGNVPMEEMVGVWSRAFARVGYDFDASIHQAVHEAGQQEYQKLSRSGGLAYIVPIFNALKADKWAYMVKNGWIRNRTAQEVVVFANSIGVPIEARMPADVNDAPSQLEQVRKSALQKSQILCGTVSRYSSPVTSVNHVWFTDENGEDMGDFFFANDDESCQSMVQEGQTICFSYLGERPNTLGLESLGIEGRTLRWICQCTEPN